MDKISQFLFMCKYSSLEKIKDFLNSLSIDDVHKCINITNSHLNNCLHIVCKYNKKNPDVIRYLIEDLKMDVGTVNEYGETCLTFASRWAPLDIIKIIITKMIELNGSKIYEEYDKEINDRHWNILV